MFGRRVSEEGETCHVRTTCAHVPPVWIQRHNLDHGVGYTPLPSWARNPGCKMLFKDVESRPGCQGVCIWASLVPLFEKAKIAGFLVSFHFNVE